MKFYTFGGCIVVLFTILPTAYLQFHPCHEIEYILPVSQYEREELNEEYVDVRLMKATSPFNGVCLLVAWDSENCGPVRMTGFVLSRNFEVRPVDIYSYNKDSSKHWLTEAMIQRVSYRDHIYKMRVRAVNEWKEEQDEYEPIEISREIQKRFNAYYAIVAADEDQMNYAAKLCSNSLINLNADQNLTYYAQGGYLLKRHSATEESYDLFETAIRAQYDDLFQFIKANVPPRDNEEIADQLP